jgi:uroporphyrinogen-III synthase
MLLQGRMDDMKACVITRTEPGAQATAEAVRGLGLNPLIMPAARVEITPASLDLEGVQALLMTSAAAARAIQVSDTLKVVPLYAVGDATAEAAVAAGFETVISAGGDGATLAVLAADRMSPRQGALLHLRGREVAGDVTGMLRACGFEARHVEVYATHDHPDFKANIIAELSKEGGFILIHSPAGSRRLAVAVSDAATNLRAWRVVGLSSACIKPLEELGFKSTSIADSPDEEALMEALRDEVEKQSLE